MAWAKKHLGVDLASKASSDLYEINVRIANAELSDSAFLRGLNGVLLKLAETYKKGNGADLFLTSAEPPSVDLLRKPYRSVVDKMFRRNVVLNAHWPEPPDGGWTNLDNVYSTFDDLLRTTITTKFLDGPGIVVAGLKDFAGREGLGTHVRVHSREEGYYAHHLYVEFSVLLANATGTPAPCKIFVELQVTTHTQDLLRKLTHQYYSKERSVAERDTAWKWDYGTNRFRARYLSHTFHLLESLILEVRDHRDPK